MPLPAPHDLPTCADGAPKPVAEALASAQAAGAILEQARSEVAAANAAVDQADAVDRAADTKAVAAGKPLPNKKAGPAAREALAEAHRKADAAGASWTEAAWQFTAALTDHQAAWLEALAAEEQEAGAAAREAIEAFAEASARLDEIRRIKDNVLVFKPGRRKPLMAWTGISFYAGRRGKRPFAEKREEIRSGLRGLSLNMEDLDRLLVELELAATQETPWVEREAKRPRERWVDESEVRR